MDAPRADDDREPTKPVDNRGPADTPKEETPNEPKKPVAGFYRPTEGRGRRLTREEKHAIYFERVEGNKPKIQFGLVKNIAQKRKVTVQTVYAIIKEIGTEIKGTNESTPPPAQEDR